MSRSAQAILVLLALALLVPALAMNLQSTASLERFHNRVLTPWPGAFARDPARYFTQANRWLADRIYPIVAATYLKNNLAYFVLHASPTPNITVGPGGFVFLNGTDAASENNLVALTCVQPTEPANRARLEAALRRIADFGRRQGFAIDVLMVPTIPLLYGDRLPSSVPPALRAACAAGAAGPAPMSRIAIPEGLRFVYPFQALKDMRDDLAMFPMGNYHASGLSVRTVTDAFLQAIGAPKPEVTMTLGSGPSEILESRGVTAPFPIYTLAGSDAVSDDETANAVRAAVRRFYGGPGMPVSVYRNPEARDPETVLILSDSFGYNQANDFASAFRTVVQVEAPHRDVAPLLDTIAGLIRFDRLVLVFNDNNLGRLSEFGENLPATTDR